MLASSRRAERERPSIAQVTMLAVLIACTVMACKAVGAEGSDTSPGPPQESGAQKGHDLPPSGDAEAYREAAEKGDAKAQCQLGGCYQLGRGVPKDDVQAVAWYRKAAEQGHAEAQRVLGYHYEHGQGVPRDDVQAVAWYRKAAEQDDAPAQSSLGGCYHSGHGVVKDDVQAVAWRRKAAEQGDATIQWCLGNDYEFGRDVPQDMIQAVAWCRKAADQGDATASYDLGRCYLTGQGILRDVAQGVAWYRKAADQGDAHAQANLGCCYAFGQGVAQDFVQAVAWYRKAAEQGDADAQARLGACYQTGQGVAQDFVQAVAWYRKAAEQGDARAQCCLGSCYKFGQGFPQNFTEAYFWLSLAAGQGVSLATEGRDEMARRLPATILAETQRRAREWKPGATAKTAAARVVAPDQWIAAGTGFLIAPRAMVTANHVVKNLAVCHVRLGGFTLSARVVIRDEANDLAIVILDRPATATPLPLGTVRGLTLGVKVWTLGFPNTNLQGEAVKLTEGSISALSGIQDDPRHFQISVPVQPGNSGGPLVDANGTVVGVVVSRLDDAVTLNASGALPQNVNYAVKSSYLLALLDRLPAEAGALPEPLAHPAPVSTEVMIQRVQPAVALIQIPGGDR